jgi:hypothetical protein
MSLFGVAIATLINPWVGALYAINEVFNHPVRSRRSTRTGAQYATPEYLVV